VFQSSPDPKVGCYRPRQCHRPSPRCFNPHPTRRSGATPDTQTLIHDPGVSILTRPEGRVLRLCRSRRKWHLCFNPHPTRRSGATRRLIMGLPTGFVSILTRPEGRVLQMCGHNSSFCMVFQSSPDPKVGCYARAAAWSAAASRFQSSPDPKVGCYLVGIAEAVGQILFQSSPDPKVGCYRARYVRVDHLIVSILTRPEGRVLRELAELAQLHGGFNPHPTRRSGATTASPAAAAES